ncbi:MAG: 30S ribosomal protein S1 [Candidatus Marinimicrobia bacterium]|nr:30S ribosomal protein S1 [Candidatus Neomarinimicrobiota bacterium]
MSENEINNPETEIVETTERSEESDSAATSGDDPTAAEAQAEESGPAATSGEDATATEAQTEETASDIEAADTPPETPVDTEPVAKEDEDSLITPEEESAEREPVDYLSSDLLDSITQMTPEQLNSLEAAEVAKKDRSLEELVSSSVGDIREDKVITGRVIGMNEREILVDIGFKSEGIVPRDEFGDQEIPQIGDEIMVYLVRLEDSNGQTVLSKEKADFMRHWADITQKSIDGETVLGRISRRIKGGMIVDLSGIPAFLPGSQIDIRPVQDFDEFIGREFEFKIVKLNEARKNIVLSRKELLEADMMEKRQSLISQLEVGQILEGRVKNITDFGVFVDLGGLDGLLHITDLSWGRVSHPSEVVNLDESITIKVIDFDPEKQRVSLGLKQLTPHPWESVEAKYPADSMITGKVVSMTNYGAFVELEKGVEGLVHVSEMSWTRHIRHPSEMFTLGETIETKILNVDVAERKISLGVKQLQPDPWDQIEEKYQVGTIQRGQVRNLTQFGAFVELEQGIDGLIHITDLSWTINVRHPKEILSKGDDVEVRILDVSRENRRIALGLKQVSEDPWDQIETFFTTGKQTTGEVFRILDKGVILKMELEVEGIIPLREIPKHERRSVTAHLKPGDVLKVTVQELSIDDKKVVLMTDVLAAGESAIVVPAAAATEEAVDQEELPAPKEKTSREKAVAEEARDSDAEAETRAAEATAAAAETDAAVTEVASPAVEAAIDTEQAPKKTRKSTKKTAAAKTGETASVGDVGAVKTKAPKKTARKTSKTAGEAKTTAGKPKGEAAKKPAKKAAKQVTKKTSKIKSKADAGKKPATKTVKKAASKGTDDSSTTGQDRPAKVAAAKGESD